MNTADTTRRGAIVPPAEGATFDKWVGVRNVYEAILRSAATHGAKTAITLLGNDLEASPLRLSYAQLANGVMRMANAVRALGLRRNDVVAYMLPSLPETQFVLWGSETAASALPLNPLLKAEEIAGLCRSAGVRVLVALGPQPGAEIWQKAQRVKDMLPSVETLIQVAGEPLVDRRDVRQLSDLLREQPAQLNFRDLPGPDDTAAFFHTGGTTGAPKLAIHTHRNQLAAAFGSACAAAAGPDDVIVNGLPMFHVAGTIFCGLAMFVAGAEVVILTPSGFRNPRVVADFWRIVERTGARMVGGVPTSLSAVVKVDPGDADFSRVRTNFAGASLLPRGAAEQMERITGKPIREVYGMTEAGGVICVDPTTRERVLGSAGCPLPFCEVQARPLVDGQISELACKPGQPGVLVVRGPNVSPGYKDAAQTRGLFTADGWLITGDVAKVDESGRVFITGRSKDLIIRSGHNIDPASIEECLMRNPAVADVAAVGMPDAYAGEVPVAYVTLRAGATASAEELIAFAGPHLEPPALPRRVFFLERLPTTAVGKVFKPALRRDCAERHLRELLRSEPIKSLTVSEEPGRGHVVRIALHRQEPQDQECRTRIDAALKPYLLSIDLTVPQEQSA